LLCILIFLFLSLSAFADDSSVDIKGVIDHLEKQVSAYGDSGELEKLKEKFGLRKQEVLKMVREKDFQDIVERVRSREFMDQVANATGEIIRWTGEAGNKNSLEDLEFYRSVYDQDNLDTWVLVVFMSSSMGKDFQLYVNDLDILLNKQLVKWHKLCLVPYGVLRGVLEEDGKPSIMKTVLWLQNILKNKKVQVLIDPILFRQYSISSVPCVLLTRYSSLANRSCSESYLGCGYSVFGFLRVVEGKTKNESLKSLLRQLN